MERVNVQRRADVVSLNFMNRERIVLEWSVIRESEIPWVWVRGRMDGMTSREVQRELEALVAEGERILVLQLEGVHYLSSAGLRVLVGTQKQLGKVGGELILVRASEPVFNVLELGGLLKAFRMVEGPGAVLQGMGSSPEHAATREMEREGAVLSILESPGSPAGQLSVIGSQDPLAGSAYTEQDVVCVDPRHLSFGAGLAAVGDSFEDVRDLFGEAVLLQGGLYYYPAAPRATVDFMLGGSEGGGYEARFLHGFGFTGAFRYRFAFEGKEKFLSLQELLGLCFQVSEHGCLGVVFLAESKGLWGMHLKRVPLAENRPEDGLHIFDPSHFARWMDFPVEPSDIHHIVAGVGVAVRDPGTSSPITENILPAGQSSHVHGIVFSRGPISKDLTQLEAELRRVPQEFQVLKVQHLLRQSLLSSGLVGLVELD